MPESPGHGTSDEAVNEMLQMVKDRSIEKRGQARSAEHAHRIHFRWQHGEILVGDGLACF